MKKKNRRVLKYNERYIPVTDELRSVNGGILIQNRDSSSDEDNLKVVSTRKPTETEMRNMLFALKVCKHCKSNAVVFAKNLSTLGIGAGQTSRVDSSMLAVSKAKRYGHDLSGSVVASDAFFPFPDGVEEAAKAGATAVIQPGGSLRDEEVIKVADTLSIAMVFTGIRHFKH